MKSFVLPIQHYIKTLLFGNRCYGCGKNGNALCLSCFSTIKPSLPTESTDTYALYAYNDPLVHRALWDLKYHHRGLLMRALIAHSNDAVQTLLSDILQSPHQETAVLVPIPQYKTKQYQRGFNQSEMVATWLSAHHEGFVIQNLLVKTKQTTPQSHITSKQERLANIRGVFSCAPETTIDPSLLYIVIDDVTTTGATLSEALSVLKTHGATRVIGLAIAHGYKQ